MIAFRTQVMLVMTGLVIATAVLLGVVLILVRTGVMHRQVEGAGRGLAQLLAAQLDQQREIVDRLVGAPRPLPGTASGQPPLSGGGNGPRSGANFEADLQELADVVRAQRIALVAEGRVIVSVSARDAAPSDIPDEEIVALGRELQDAAPGTMKVAWSDASVAVMTMLRNPGPSGQRPALLVQLPKTRPREVAGASASILVAAGLLVVAAAIADAWFLSRSISRPLTRLADTARAYGEGALDEAAPVAGPAETRRLGMVLNSMASSLKQQMRDLEEETRRREKLESELRVAANLQRSLLPPPGLQQFGPIEVLGWSEAAESVGGDFYDFRLVNPDTLAFLIGDATGKGMPAALLAAKCLSVLQALTEAQTEPGELLCHANKLLWEQFRGQGRFVTAFLGIVDLPSRRLHYARAGHNPPYLTQNGNTPAPLANPEGLPLAVISGASFESTVLECTRGDALLLYTDGITETHDAKGALYGDDRLRQLFAQHVHQALPDLLDTLTADVRRHSTHWPPVDDCTALFLRFSN